MEVVLVWVEAPLVVEVDQRADVAGPLVRTKTNLRTYMVFSWSMLWKLGMLVMFENARVA